MKQEESSVPSSHFSWIEELDPTDCRTFDELGISPESEIRKFFPRYPLPHLAFASYVSKPGYQEKCETVVYNLLDAGINTRDRVIREDGTPVSYLSLINLNNPLLNSREIAEKRTNSINPLASAIFWYTLSSTLLDRGCSLCWKHENRIYFPVWVREALSIEDDSTVSKRKHLSAKLSLSHPYAYLNKSEYEIKSSLSREEIEKRWSERGALLMKIMKETKTNSFECSSPLTVAASPEDIEEFKKENIAHFNGHWKRLELTPDWSMKAESSPTPALLDK